MRRMAYKQPEEFNMFTISKPKGNLSQCLTNLAGEDFLKYICKLFCKNIFTMLFFNIVLYINVYMHIKP